MNVHPLSDNLLVRRHAEEETSPGGIIIPPTVERKERVFFATVLAVGPGRPLKKGGRAAMQAAKGDVVICPEYNPPVTATGLDDEVLYWVRDRDLFGVVS